MAFFSAGFYTAKALPKTSRGRRIARCLDCQRWVRTRFDRHAGHTVQTFAYYDAEAKSVGRGGVFKL